MRACSDRLPHHTGDPNALTLSPQHPQERRTSMNNHRLSEESVSFTEKELRKTRFPDIMAEDGEETKHDF